MLAPRLEQAHECCSSPAAPAPILLATGGCAAGCGGACKEGELSVPPPPCQHGVVNLHRLRTPCGPPKLHGQPRASGEESAGEGKDKVKMLPVLPLRPQSRPPREPPGGCAVGAGTA